MKRILRLFFMAVLVAIVCATLVACSTKTSTGDEHEETTKTVTSVSVDKSTIPTNMRAGSAVLTAVKLLVTYDNGEKETVYLSNEYLTVQSRNKLLSPGLQTLEVIYEQCTCSFTIYLLDPNDVYYNLTVNGGIPTRVGEQTVSVTATDRIYTNSYKKGTEITIEWLEESGKQFAYWEANGVKIDTQPKTVVTMNNDYEYTAYSDDIVHTVRFITYNSDIPDFSLKRPSFSKEEDIVSEMSMDRYVFVGWTEREITQSESLSGMIKDELLSFPYTVESDVTFYAVWAPIGFSYTNVSIVTAGGKTIDGKQIVAYSGSLTELDIPSTSEGSNVIAISKDAFGEENAKRLTRITIPSTIVEIDEGAFRNCSSLQAFYVDAGSTTFTAEKGVLYMNDKTILVAYPLGRVASDYTLEPSVTEICDYAFYNAIVGSITMTVDVARIGERAFDSVHIDNIDFSALAASKLAKIGEGVFSAYLQNVCVDPLYEGEYRALFPSIDEKILSDKTRLNSIYVDAIDEDTSILFRLITGTYFDIKTRSAEILGVTRTPDSIVIPDRLNGKNNDYTVTSIAYYAFKDCIALENVVLPTKLERVCDHAFDDTPWASALENNSIIANETLYKYLGNESVYVLPNVKRIAESAFYENKSIEYVDNTSNHALERIDAYAFYNCSNLKGFSAGTTESSFLIKTNLKAIDAYAFSGAAFIRIETQSMARGENGLFERIGAFAFADNHYLETVDIDVNNLRSIEPESFMYCYALQSFFVAEQNETFRTINGILYEKTGTDEYVLFQYPAGKITAVFNPSKPDGENEINVTSVGEYSLWYSNVGALEFNESVSVNNAASIFIPSLTYVRFKNKVNLNNSFYSEVFQGKTGAKRFVFDPDLSAEVISGFFGNNNTLITQYATNDVEYTFYIQNDLLYAVSAGGLRVVGCERTNEERDLFVPGDVTVGGTTYMSKTIERYAFIGYNLQKLTVKGISEFADYALSGAFALTELTIDATDVSDVPTIYENSLGERFNKDLLVYVNCDPTTEGSYFDKWEGIVEVFTYEDENEVLCVASQNVIYENAFIVLTYLDKDNVRHTACVEKGSVSGEDILLVNGKNEGFSVGGWIDVNDEEGQVVDIFNGYVITYNRVLECQWLPDTYEIFFVIPDGIALAFDAEYVTGFEENGENWKKYSVEIQFSDEYKFFVTRTEFETNKYNFIGWLMGETEIPEQGVWSKLLSEKSCELKPNRPTRKYNAFDSDMNVVVPAGQTLEYGKDYVLIKPSRNGYAFVGWWYYDSTGRYIQLTDSLGAGYSEWLMTSDVVVYAEWKALEINVILKLSETDDYSITTVQFGSSTYIIGFSAGNIPEVLQNSYAGKVDFFAGWADSDGKIYTDAEGNALYEWDKYESSTLYAVWPEFISDTATLIQKVSEDDKVSVVLLEDITLTSPIACEYKGVFNGNGKKVFIQQTFSTDDEIKSGIFTINESGTIKDVEVYVRIDCNIASGTHDVYIGGVCGINNGIVENITVYVERLNISLGNATGNVFIGGLFGKNTGILRDVTETVRNDSETAFAVSFSMGGDGNIYIGSVIGANDGTVGIYSLEIRSFVINEDGESYNGERKTVGSVVGVNGSNKGTSEEKHGVVRGSCRYVASSPGDYFLGSGKVTGEYFVGDVTNLKFSSLQ